MIEISLIERNEQLAGLESIWDGLVGQSAEDNPFRRWLWNATWWKHYGRGRRLSILLAAAGGEPVGIAPLYLDKPSSRLAGRDLRFLGTGEVCSEYLGPIVRRGAEGEVIPAMLRFLLDRRPNDWDMLRWTDIPADAAELPPMDSFLAERGLACERRPGTTNLLVRLGDTWDEYLAGLSSKRRTKLRRIAREFDELPQSEFAIVDRQECWETVWGEFRRLHSLHWESEGGRGCFASPQFQSFHSELVPQLLHRGMLVLGSLRVSGEAVAACYGIRWGHTVYEYQRGHDPQWLARRPGHALQFRLFRDAIERGVRTWDYLRGDYPHKRDWATHERSTVSLMVPAPRRLASHRFCVERAIGGARRRLSRWRRLAAERLGARRAGGGHS